GGGAGSLNITPTNGRLAKGRGSLRRRRAMLGDRRKVARLKTSFFTLLRSASLKSFNLSRIVLALIRAGVSRGTCVLWAVECGFSKAGARSLLSRLLCEAGLRERKPGAGRKFSPRVI